MKPITASLLAILYANFCMGQNNLPVKKISIFKNGTAMMVREGIAPVRSGHASLPVPSHAIYGTYFLGTAKDNPVTSIAIKNDTLKKQTNALSVWQLVAGNVGKKATISFAPAQKLDKSISGKILSYSLQTGLIHVQEDNGKIAAIHSTDLYMVEFAEDESRTYMADSIQRSLVLSPQNPADNLSLEEIYLQTGINWMPSYFLKLKDDKTARLEMKATIENFSDAISDAETELIVGAPQMINSARPDPMTYDYQTVDAVPAAKNYAYSNVMQTRGAYAAMAAEDKPAFENTYTTAGEKNADMYIYKIGKVTLGKDAKGIYPIFAGNIEYKDKYEGIIPDQTNFYSTHNADNGETPYDVFHSIEIKNSASVPLTTAPVTLVNEKEQFMAQDELKYTPVGATSHIRLSKAVDIIMKNAEEESARTDNAKRIGKQVYSSVKLKGTVTIENFQEKEATIEVTKEISGEATSASDAGRIVKPKGRAGLNPSTRIKWEVKMAANEKKTLTYEYGVFFLP